MSQCVTVPWFGALRSTGARLGKYAGVHGLPADCDGAQNAHILIYLYNPLFGLLQIAMIIDPLFQDKLEFLFKLDR